MVRDMVVSRYAIPTGIPRIDGLSTGLSGFGVSQRDNTCSLHLFPPP